MDKVVIAVDSFKGTMSSIKVAAIIEEAFKQVMPDLKIIKVPIADGGEGTVDCFLAALGGEKVRVEVSDPLLRKIESFYGLLPDEKTAIIEVAAASGLPLIEGEENPLITSSFGSGELIFDALERGCRKFIIGLGGSATNDGGVGLAAALGVRFLNADFKEISLNGAGLKDLKRIDLRGRDPRLEECEIVVACDVSNPLYGEQGATHVFAPQKGADEEVVRVLDENLRNYAEVITKDLNISVHNVPGAGAAGGLGAGLLAFFDAKLKPGIDIVLEQVNFDKLSQDADLVITGEGKIDGQSLYGKVPVGIAQRAKKNNIPVIAIVGDVGEGAEMLYRVGLDAIFSINRIAAPFCEIKYRAEQDLLATSIDVARLLKIGLKYNLD